MKFYVHCEEPAFTIVMNWETGREDTFGTVLDMFVKQLDNKYPQNSVTNKTATLYNAKGTALNLAKSIWKHVKHMDDLYVRFCDTDSAGDPLLSSNAQKSNMGESAKKASCQDTIFNKDIDDAVSCEINNVLDEKSSSAVVCTGNGKYRNALHLYNEMLEIDPANLSAKKGLITCYLRAGRIKDGLMLTNATLKEVNHDLDLLLMKGQLLIASGDGDGAIGTLLSYSKLARQKGGINADDKRDVQVLLAKGYLIKKQNDMAINILQGVLREDKEHTDALAEYATVLFPLGSVHSEEAMNVLLTLLAKNPDNKRIKQKFADACSSPHGMTVLNHVAENALRDVAALVFLATSLRDYSAVTEAISLMEQALSIDPGNAQTVLTYVHMLELVDRHKDGIIKIKDFVRINPAKRLHNLSFAVLDLFLNELFADSSETEVQSKIFESQVTIEGNVQLSDEERYILAVFFTLIKILYICAELKPIPLLLKMLNPYCEEQDLHLTNIRNEAAYFSCIAEVFKAWNHSSTYLDKKATLADRKCVYFLGDSHCIPPAWQEIVVQGKPHLIKPVLSTGTKIWHLRPEGRFYPKTNFYSSIRVIPDNADVISCFGEIDCREAMLVCWEKARYDTIEDAMETVVQIYLNVLKDLQKKHQWTIYIHPVLPVLDLTRPIVMQFNKILAVAVKEEPAFHWLEFVGDLLTDDGLALKEEFKLDGTHVHPSYVALIESAIKRLCDG